jgi:hypothetical protein
MGLVRERPESRMPRLFLVTWRAGPIRGVAPDRAAPVLIPRRESLGNDGFGRYRTSYERFVEDDDGLLMPCLSRLSAGMPNWLRLKSTTRR